MRMGVDRDIELCEYQLKPGYIFLSKTPVVISTIVGSCVAVALWDSQISCGGMVHYLYPLAKAGVTPTAKYGNVAVSHLVEMFFQEGASRETMKAQLFGGASNGKANRAIAEENVSVARQVLDRNGIKIVSEDIGGGMGRKLIYNTMTNETIVYKANQLRKGDWYPYRHAGRRS